MKFMRWFTFSFAAVLFVMVVSVSNGFADIPKDAPSSDGASAGELGEIFSEEFIALVPDAKLVGAARFKVLFFKIYDAELFAPDAIYTLDQPYALRLTYLINAKKDRIVSQTVKEMKRQKAADSATIQSWIPAMEKAFISMDSGSFADFIHTPDGRLTLLGNGEPISVIADPELSRAIMNIWLGPNIRSQDFQNKLLSK